VTYSSKLGLSTFLGISTLPTPAEVDSLGDRGPMFEIGSSQQYRVRYRLLVAIKAVSIQFQHTSTSTIQHDSHIRTWTDSSVKSSDVAKLKASIVSGVEAGRCYMPWVGIIV
jgi:hypothetical protein